jgi:two-component sensor histidine kinase
MPVGTGSGTPETASSSKPHRQRPVQPHVKALRQTSGGSSAATDPPAPARPPCGGRACQTYANLLAAAIDRHQIHHQLADALERGHMLQAELLHRGRNLLANIEALVRRTAASSAGLDEFSTAFLARLAALFRTEDLLAKGPSSPISLRTILLRELEAHGAEPGERVSVSGPDLILPPPIAQALAMGFHELATNAAKHGALGREAGRLAVTWSREPGVDGFDIVVHWRETGTPIPSPPPRRGMGMETIERSLPRMLDGSAELRFSPAGAECVIRFPEPRDSDM